MDKITFTAIALCAFAAAPAIAGPSACLADCAARHDGKEASCRVKSGSDLVKSCIDGANAAYASCRQACANKYKLNEQKQGPASSTQPSSATTTTPSQPPAVK